MATLFCRLDHSKKIQGYATRGCHGVPPLQLRLERSMLRIRKKLRQEMQQSNFLDDFPNAKIFSTDRIQKVNLIEP